MDTVVSIRNVACPQTSPDAMVGLAQHLSCRRWQSKIQADMGNSAQLGRAFRPEQVFGLRHFGFGGVLNSPNAAIAARNDGPSGCDGGRSSPTRPGIRRGLRAL